MKDFLTLLTKKYNEVIAEHNDFKSIVWIGKEKKFVTTLKDGSKI